MTEKFGGIRETVGGDKNEGIKPIVNSNETQSVDTEIKKVSVEIQQKLDILKSLDEAAVLRLMKNREKKGRFVGFLEALKRPLNAIKGHWPEAATALVATMALIAAFALDADVESSKIQISDVLAGAGVIGEFIATISYLGATEKEKGGTSATPQYA